MAAKSHATGNSALVVHAPIETIVIAAPSCCGKTYFSDSLKSDALPEFNEILHIDTFQDWDYKDAFYLDSDSSNELIDASDLRLILHWTIVRPTLKIFLRNVFHNVSYEKKSRADLLRSKKSTVLTLIASPTALADRVALRKKRSQELLEEGRRSRYKHLIYQFKLNSIHRFYRNTEQLARMYDRWNHFCIEQGVHHNYLIDVTSEPKLVGDGIHEHYPLMVNQLGFQP
ncbi:MAG: hypothetical protein AAF434_12050 [Pseudomonadota bacterium]